MKRIVVLFALSSFPLLASAPTNLAKRLVVLAGLMLKEESTTYRSFEFLCIPALATPQPESMAKNFVLHDDVTHFANTYSLTITPKEITDTYATLSCVLAKKTASIASEYFTETIPLNDAVHHTIYFQRGKPVTLKFKLSIEQDDE